MGVSMKPVDVREGQDRAANGTCLRHSYQRVEAREEDGSLGQVANTNGEQRVKCDRFLGCAAVGNVVIQHVDECCLEWNGPYQRGLGGADKS